MHKASFGLAGLAVLAVLGARHSSPAASYVTLDEGAEPLKSAFNTDVGKVRVVMLVAPT